MNDNILTLQKLKDMQPGSVIASGITTNTPEGVYMSDENYGIELRWVAKRGNIHDWAIYIAKSTRSIESVLYNGDKVHSSQFIRKLVPCDDESFEMYRH